MKGQYSIEFKAEGFTVRKSDRDLGFQKDLLEVIGRVKIIGP